MKHVIRRRGAPAFTLVELMIAVAIVSILASVGIPSFMKYVKKSKTVEAGINLRKLYDGEVAYYLDPHVDANGLPLSRQFMECPPTPDAVPRASKGHGIWTGGWESIQFGIDTYVTYQYRVVTNGVDVSAEFTARAVGDLDGNNTEATYERWGWVEDDGTARGEVFGSSGLLITEPFE
jgi:prepilin-type N-terminal cleavage/methylation domain-containing protein